MSSSKFEGSMYYYSDTFDSLEAQKFMQTSYLQDDDENVDGMLKLFVGGLNYLSLQSDIKSYFETFGKVLNCTLLIDKASGKSRGFAFVSIEDYSGELKDKVLSRKHEINGKIVDVKLAVEGKKREEMLDSSKKIFVGGLDPTVTNGKLFIISLNFYSKKDDLRQFFSYYGIVREAVVLFDNNRGASRCFGFVTFDSKETVDSLVKNKNYVIKGKQVEVKQAQPKANQKSQNITCQSGVDLVLNNSNIRNKAMQNKDFGMMNENSEFDDKKFLDMVTNTDYNSKDFYQKYNDKSNFNFDYPHLMNKMNENMMYSYMFDKESKKFQMGKK